MNSMIATQRNETPTGGRDTQGDFGSNYETKSSLTRRSSELRRQVTHLDEDSRQLHRNALRTELDERTRRWARSSTQELLQTLRAWGFAWRDVARIVGVSVPAIQKWRKGASSTGENRRKLARLVAVVEYIEEEYLVNEPASWFEMPITANVHVTALDLSASGDDVLVVELASEQAAPEAVLDEFEPDWRDKFVDQAFEVFVAEDGSRAIRPKD